MAALLLHVLLWINYGQHGFEEAPAPVGVGATLNRQGGSIFFIVSPFVSCASRTAICSNNEPHIFYARIIFKFLKCFHGWGIVGLHNGPPMGFPNSISLNFTAYEYTRDEMPRPIKRKKPISSNRFSLIQALEGWDGSRQYGDVLHLVAHPYLNGTWLSFPLANDGQGY